MNLRPYQTQGLRRIQQALDSGCERALVVSPVGSGKGTMIAALATTYATAGKRVLIIAHRREIVLDLRDRVREQFAHVGILLPGEREDPKAPIQVASTQTLLGRSRLRYDLVLVDEAHHYLADEWRELLGVIGERQCVGFTATPQRRDGRPMGDAFDELIDVVSMSALIREGLIVPCDVLRPESYTGIDLAQDPVTAYVTHAPGSRAFIFTRDVATANRCVRDLREHGISSAVIHAGTTSANRARHVDDLRSGKISVICNAYTMTEGIDVPEVSTIVLARNCTHWGAYVQMTGRALRPCKGKASAKLIDLHGVSLLPGIGMPTQDREHSLAGSKLVAETSRPSYPREREEAREPFVLDLDLVKVSGSTIPALPANDHAEVDARRPDKLSTPVALWAALMRDVKRGVLTLPDAQSAYLAQHGRAS